MKVVELEPADLKHWDTIRDGALKTLGATLRLDDGRWYVIDGPAGVKIVNAYISGFLAGLKTDKE